MAKGFFSSKDINKASAQVVGEARCIKCGLFKKGVHTPQMKATGEGKKGILFIAEAPGGTEDRRGVQLVGKAGQLLRRELKHLNIDLDKDCRKINAVNCRPPKNRTPTPEEIDYCRPMVFQEIRDNPPKKIILLGNVALDSFLQHRWQEDLKGIGKWRGWKTPDRDVKAWVFAMYHPSFIQRLDHKQGKIYWTTFRRDLKEAINFKPSYIDWDWEPERDVTILKDPLVIKKVIDNYIRTNSLTSFDYETTGKKPYAKGHAIHTASIANKRGAVSFPMYPEVQEWFVKFLQSDVPKTAHNAKFEDIWSRTILGTPINNLIWCSMLAAHVLDNRRRTKSLKFLTYTHFGSMSWVGDVGRYLRTSSKDANAFNKIKDAPLDDLLLYGGIDSLVQLKLALHQMGELKYAIKR